MNPFLIIIIASFLSYLLIPKRSEEEYHPQKLNKDDYKRLKDYKSKKDFLKNNEAFIKEIEAETNLSFEDEELMIAEKKIGKSIDSLIFEEAKQNAGVISIPRLCIKTSISAEIIKRSIDKLESGNLVFSTLDKSANFVYIVKEFLSDERKKEFDL